MAYTLITEEDFRNLHQTYITLDTTGEIFIVHSMMPGLGLYTVNSLELVDNLKYQTEVINRILRDKDGGYTFISNDALQRIAEICEANRLLF